MSQEHIWIISDLHLGRHNITVTYPTKRKKGFEYSILSAWDACVSNKDVVVILGDVAVGRIRYWMSRIQEMPGRKIMMIGHCDKNRPKWYQSFGLERVVPFNEVLTVPATRKYEHLGKIMLSHIPAFSSVLRQEQDKAFSGLSEKFGRIYSAASCILNIHGHTMGEGNEDHRTFDAGVDVMGYAPRRLDQILEAHFSGDHR